MYLQHFKTHATIYKPPWIFTSNKIPFEANYTVKTETPTYTQKNSKKQIH